MKASLGGSDSHGKKARRAGFELLAVAAIALTTISGMRPLAFGATEGRGVDSIQLSTWPLLLADDSGIANRTGLVRTVHAASTHPAPVLTADRPWEGERVYVYGSIYRDENTREYRLWYVGSPGRENESGTSRPRFPRSGTVTMLATSSDGIAWEKPALNVHAFRGSSANNIVYDLHSASVLRDELETDPAKRYKMLGSLPRPTNAYQAAFSADGLHWNSYPKGSVLEHGDTITLSQDPRTGEYLAFHKRPARVRGFGRRVVWLSRSRDFQTWSEPELVFAPDEQDDSWASRPNERTEVYNMSVYPHAGGFIGLPGIFRVMAVGARDQVGPGQSAFDGPIDTQLATSIDGSTWQRSWPRMNIIPRGAPGAFDGGTILGVSSTAVHTDRETWVYYTAINTSHGGTLPPKRISIGRAVWRRHGFVSLDAGPEGGRLTTRPLLGHGGALVVNADASRGGLRVAVLESDGRPLADFRLEDCEPLQSDATLHRVRWKSGRTIPEDRPLQVLIEMSGTRLFSLAGARALSM